MWKDDVKKVVLSTSQGKICRGYIQVWEYIQCKGNKRKLLDLMFPRDIFYCD